ncbi:MAG: hypothetical protein JRG76_10400 [Deltaproteobacteria bacterium]|nr:hypothetical protein [Deltaproteobacteria bacterium]MBW2414907.1 hypothetical protein [Deltaproteobacteria bacterium]
MGGQNVIPLSSGPSSRQVAAAAALPDAPILMLVFVGFEALMLLGLVGGFMLTRASGDVAWPPADHPWFAAEEIAILSATVLLSGLLTVLSGRAWKRRQAKAGPLLFAAISLGIAFVVFHTTAWLTLVNQGVPLASTQPGGFFSLTMGLHNVTAIGAIGFMGVAWLRVSRLPEHEEVQRSMRGGTLSAARILWYFVVGAWPVLYLCLYL